MSELLADASRTAPADERFAAVLNRLRTDSLPLLGADAVQLWASLRLDRPFSLVHRVEVASARALPALYVKIARPRSQASGEYEFMSRRVENDFAATQSAFSSMPSGLSVVRPVACFPGELALVTQEAPGRTLLAFLETSARWWPSAEKLARCCRVAERVGEWISAFQATRHESTSISIDELKEYLDVRLRRLVDNERSQVRAADRESLLDAFDRRARSLDPRDLGRVIAHNDMALGNILVDGTNITVLDLAMVGTGTRYHDLAHVVLQLSLLQGKPVFRPRTVAALQRALLDGFEPRTSEKSPLFELMYLQHTVCHLVALTCCDPNTLACLYNARIARMHVAWLRKFAAS